MKAPKATFTKEFSMCELLVALGVKESDTKTKIVIDNVYCDGLEDENSKFVDNVDDKNEPKVEHSAKYKDSKDEIDFSKQTWKHSTSKCYTKDVKIGEQGTLTQVFYEGKDSEGVKHYRVCSIETWLAKVEKVDKTTTSRDNHKKGEDNVKLTIYAAAATAADMQDRDYCEFGDGAVKPVTATGFTSTTLTYDDPTVC